MIAAHNIVSQHETVLIIFPLSTGQLLRCAYT